MRVLSALVVWLLLPVLARAQAVMTVYRCSDARGVVSLQDVPCAAGKRQQVLTMQRPQAPSAATKAPATVSPPSPAAPPAPPPPAPLVVYRAPPQPMYECTRPDGSRYTSDDGRGNPRWVPLWTLGGWRHPHRHDGNGTETGTPPVTDSPLWPVFMGGGQWIHDDCVMLPPAEACARLRDRRAELRRRFFNAQELERDALRREERALNARLDNDCGGH